MRLRLRVLSRHCLLLACLPSAASAAGDVTLYGIIDATVRANGNAPGTLWSAGDGAYTGSRFGLRGNEDLGGGTKAVFSLEGGFDPSTGTSLQGSSSANYGQAQATSRLFGREAYVGLQDRRLGTLMLGRQHTIAHLFSHRFQPQGNPNIDALSIFSQHHVSRQDNMTKYSLDLGDFNLTASGTAGEKQYGNAWAVGGSYRSGPVDFVAYHSQMHSVNDTELRKITGLGGSLAITDTLRGYAGFMKRDQRTGTQENRVFTAGLNHQVTPRVQFTAQHAQDRAKGLAGNARGTRKMTFVGAAYALSKRTDVYTEVDHNHLTGAYTATFLGPKDRQTGVSAGLRYRF